jgi:hypothetical protein
MSATVRMGNAADIQAFVNTAAQQASEQAVRPARIALGYMLQLFHELAVEFTAACPEFDVGEFLRQRGLEEAQQEGAA